MATNGNKKQFLLSPYGEVVFAHLNTPDKRFDSEGKYSVTVRFDPEVPENGSYLKSIEDLAKAQVGDGATVPIRDDVDKDKNRTGMKLVKYASAYQPKLFDKDNKPLDVKTVIGRGSIIRVSAIPNVYKMGGNKGINLYLQAVQARELVEPVGPGAEAYGFEAENQIEPETKKEPMDLPF